MTNWDAWNDFARALTGHLGRASAGSMVFLKVPPGVDVGLRVSADAGTITATFTPGMPLSADQVDTLSRLGWSKSKRGPYWLWHTVHDEGIMDERATLAVVQVLTEVAGADTPALIRVDLTLPDGRNRPLSDQMVPPAAPVTLDTTGWQQDRQYFVDPSTGAAMALSILDHALEVPYWLDDLDLARRYLARHFASGGCLIEANPVTVGGVRGMAQTWKLAGSGEEGTVFGVTVDLAKATQTAQITCFMRATNNMRETVVLAKLLNYRQSEPHPYDPELHSRLPWLRADDEVWDEQFPGHPLTCVRAWLRDLDRVITVDPGFAALPDFRGTTRQSGGR